MDWSTIFHMCELKKMIMHETEIEGPWSVDIYILNKIIIDHSPLDIKSRNRLLLNLIENPQTMTKVYSIWKKVLDVSWSYMPPPIKRRDLCYLLSLGGASLIGEIRILCTKDWQIDLQFTWDLYKSTVKFNFAALPQPDFSIERKLNNWYL